MLLGVIYFVWIADSFFYPFQGFLITLGVPVAVWGFATYLVLLFLAVTGMPWSGFWGENYRTIVNASGPRAALTARMAGLDVPVEPRKRTLFVFDCAQTPEGSATVNGGRLPLMIDPSGVFCRPEGRYFLSGAVPTDDPAVDWDDFEPRWEEFDDIVWPALAARSPAFESIKVVNQWAGNYDFNTLDHNVIVGRHPVVANFLFANGFSGHGLQQGPAAGRGVALGWPCGACTRAKNGLTARWYCLCSYQNDSY